MWSTAIASPNAATGASEHAVLNDDARDPGTGIISAGPGEAAASRQMGTAGIPPVGAAGQAGTLASQPKKRFWVQSVAVNE